MNLMVEQIVTLKEDMKSLQEQKQEEGKKEKASDMMNLMVEQIVTLKEDMKILQEQNTRLKEDMNALQDKMRALDNGFATLNQDTKKEEKEETEEGEEEDTKAAAH